MTVGRAISLTRILLATCAGVGAVDGLLRLWTVRGELLWSAVWTLPLRVAPSLIAACLCVWVARDYPVRSAMRTAWFLIGASASATGVSLAFNFASYVASLGGNGGPWIGLFQHAITISIASLFVALLLMWNSFARFGFGLSWRALDRWAILAIAAAAALFLAFSQEIPNGRSTAYLERTLLFVNPLLLAALAALGVLLRRVSLEIGEGQLARSLGCLLLMLIARLLVVAFFIPGVRDNLLLSTMRGAMMWSVPALLLLAVVERWRLIRVAAQIADDPAIAISADLTR